MLAAAGAVFVEKAALSGPGTAMGTAQAITQKNGDYYTKKCNDICHGWDVYKNQHQNHHGDHIYDLQQLGESSAHRLSPLSIPSKRLLLEEKLAGR
jgi:hypothetical protein